VDARLACARRASPGEAESGSPIGRRRCSDARARPGSTGPGVPNLAPHPTAAAASIERCRLCFPRRRGPARFPRRRRSAAGRSAASGAATPAQRRTIALSAQSAQALQAGLRPSIAARLKPAGHPKRAAQCCESYSGQTPPGAFIRSCAPPKAQVAQLVEHVTENHGVGGSIPPLGTIGPFADVRVRPETP
jgi:hypothetical protein